MTTLIALSVACALQQWCHADSPPSPDESRARALLDRVVEAQGGKERAGKYRAIAFALQGKVQHSGQTVEFKGAWKAQWPGRLRVDVQVPFMGLRFKYTQVFQGDKCWNALNENSQDLSKPACAEGCEQAWAYDVTRLMPLTDPAVGLRYLGESKAAGRAALVLAVHRRGRREIKLFFDKKSSLLLKTETRGRDLLDLEQEFLLETFYADYREVDGMLVPHKMSMCRDGKPYMEMECSDHKLAASLEDEEFVRP